MKTIPKKCEVLVIGGGPAGAMASALLAQKGVDVVLLEKEKFPRYTVGESLIPHFWKYTDSIGASDKIKEAGFVKKAGGFVQWGGVLRTVSFKNFGFTRPALHVERSTFDDILLRRSEELGTKVYEEVTVKSTDFSDDIASVRYRNNTSEEIDEIQARFVIDASGQNTVVPKQYDLVNFDDNFRFQAFWGYFDRSDYMNDKAEITSFENRFEDSPMTLVSDTGEWGWTWQIVLKDRVSIGTLLPRQKLKEFKNGGKNLEEQFLNYVRQTPMIAPLLSNSNLVSKVRTVRDYAYQPTKLTHKNCFFVGDAAAFFDPINSEGITIAMYGASVAAWAVENALKKPHRADFYKKAFEKNLKNRLDLFQLLAFPDELVPEHLIQKVKDSIRNQSANENYLTLAQLMITSRGKDFPKMLEAIGLPHKEVYQEVMIPELLASGVRKPSYETGNV